MRPQARRSAGYAFALLMVTLLSNGPALAGLALQPLPNHQGQFLMLDAGEAGHPITLESRLRLGSWEELENLEHICLLGLGAVADAPPALLALQLIQETASWFPTWTLRLQSSELFPGSLPGRRDQGSSDGAPYLNLGAVTPKPGHVVESRLSYDPVSGRADISVIDLTEKTALVARAFALEPYQGSLIPSVGAVPDAQGVQVEQFLARPYRVPFGLSWDLMAKEEGRFKRLALMRLTAGNDLALWLGPDTEELPGRLVLVAAAAAAVTTVFELPAQARTEARLLPFAAGELPLGVVELALRYIDEDNTAWQLGGRQLHIVAGNLNVDFGDLAIVGESLQGQVRVASQDGTILDLPVRVYATFLKPGTREALGEPHLVMERSLPSVSTSPTTVPLTIPIAVAEPIFGLTLEARFGTEVGCAVTGAEYYVLR